LDVFECVSVVTAEGACVRNCRWLGLYTVSTVHSSAGGECAGWKGSVVTGWERIGRRGEDESVDEKGQKE
jgi:hypothetical protein